MTHPRVTMRQLRVLMKELRVTMKRPRVAYGALVLAYRPSEREGQRLNAALRLWRIRQRGLDVRLSVADHPYLADPQREGHRCLLFAVDPETGTRGEVETTLRAEICKEFGDDRIVGAIKLWTENGDPIP
jgi:hypothetical protein